MTTIIAPASALGGGVAVLRLSGPEALLVLQKLSGQTEFNPRMAYLVQLHHPTTKAFLDKALALYFKAPHSFTGEDVVELHVHGGRAIVQSVLEASMAASSDIRLAEGGEFSKRAYLNGKIDLTEAEAIADLVTAETVAQADQARAQMNGSLRDLYEGWRHALVPVLAHLEATIDFVDEEDIPAGLLQQTTAKLQPIAAAFEAHLDDAGLGERLRDGFVVTVVGAPNAGKSSLVNALVQRDVAIVSSIAGTTRDALEAHVNIGGYPVILIDTAGLRETIDTIETIGIARARKKAENADLILALFDTTQPTDSETLSLVDERTIIVQTKADLVAQKNEQSGISISTETGENLDALQREIAARLASLTKRPSDAPPLLTRARHRAAVTEALHHLQRAIQNNDVVLLTEDVRLAVRALGRLTGRVDVEDLLDVIFHDFCIGK